MTKRPLPHTYRMIAGGDIVPVFNSGQVVEWLVLHDDGTVTWTLDSDESNGGKNR